MTLPNRPLPAPSESVWDYPRPPRLEPTAIRIRITHGTLLLVDTVRALRLLETSHPPVFYIPPTDIAMQHLKPSLRPGSFCEFKGSATYWSIRIDPSAELSARPEDLPSSSKPAVTTTALHSPDAAWSYAHPTPAYAALRDHLAFYAGRPTESPIECTVDGEPVQPQPGGFYGGWITSRVTGPFKGPPGTLGW